MKQMPRITVLLPVFNGMPHVRHAVASLLMQTFRDFILHIVNDGSTDETGSYLDCINDPRVKVTHQRNAGLAVTLNRMVDDADTEFLARMDADDICLPERFSRQVEFLDQHPDVAVVGTRQGYVRGKNSVASICLLGKIITPGYSPPMSDPPYWHPANDGQILVHSSVMMRTKIIQSVGGYPEIVPGQDLALWYRLAGHGQRMANLDEMLMLIRISPGGISSKNLARQYHTWCHIAESWKNERDGIPVVSLDEYVTSHPLTRQQLRELESKARLRNALALHFEGRNAQGLAGLLLVAWRDPKLIFEKLRSRLAR
jgi:glycosyltransferase involved in cell wall biosynthesis